MGSNDHTLTRPYVLYYINITAALSIRSPPNSTHSSYAGSAHPTKVLLLSHGRELIRGRS